MPAPSLSPSNADPPWMSLLGDRILMTIVVVTALAGLLGYWLTLGVPQLSRWYTQYALPLVLVVALLVVVVVVWEGLDLMD